MAMIPSARSSALVGVPNWSLTTEMVARWPASASIVRAKLLAERTIDPSGAQNDVVAGGGGNGVFAP